VPAALSYAQPIVIQLPPAEEQPPPQVDVTVNTTETPAPATPSVTPPPTPEPETTTEKPAEDPNVTEAMAKLDEARAAFLKGEYARAQELIEKGIEKVPGDATLHEFRALTQFAQKKYRDAAGTIYAVLAVGPGWNWDTLKSFYDNEQTYKDQLRALEEHSRANPNASEDHFLLAYHYLVLDAKGQAIRQLEEVVKLMPKDQLSAALLKALKDPPPTDRPQPQP
jgi:predicted Zn-dependent protease